MAIAQWRLARTKMAAPTDGAINNLTVRAGDTAQANVPLIGIIDATAWRIIANYKQSYIRIPLTEFAPWLLALTAGVGICCHVQASERGVDYVGTQAAIVFIITLVQGVGAPTDILPGVDRFAGVTCGLMVLLAVSLLLWPSQDAALKDAAGKARS